jgi:FtsH-binding integral membrane protein
VFLTRVFAWMSFGLVLSEVTAYQAGTNASTAYFLQHGGWKLLLVLLAPLAILILMQAVIDGISAGTDYVLLYAVFCAVDGSDSGSCSPCTRPARSRRRR